MYTCIFHIIPILRGDLALRSVYCSGSRQSGNGYFGATRASTTRIEYIILRSQHINVYNCIVTSFLQFSVGTESSQGKNCHRHFEVCNRVFPHPFCRARMRNWFNPYGCHCLFSAERSFMNYPWLHHLYAFLVSKHDRVPAYYLVQVRQSIWLGRQTKLQNVHIYNIKFSD